MGGGRSSMALPSGSSFHFSSKIYALSVEELVEVINSLGEAYTEYEAAFMQRNIDGKFLRQLKDQDIASTLAELGVHDEVHAKALEFLLRSLRQLATPVPVVDATSPPTDDTLEQLDVLFRAGNTLFQQGKLEDARSCYQRTMVGYERVHGTTHPSYLGVRPVGVSMSVWCQYDVSMLVCQCVSSSASVSYRQIPSVRQHMIPPSPTLSYPPSSGPSLTLAFFFSPSQPPLPVNVGGQQSRLAPRRLGGLPGRPGDVRARPRRTGTDLRTRAHPHAQHVPPPGRVVQKVRQAARSDGVLHSVLFGVQCDPRGCTQRYGWLSQGGGGPGQGDGAPGSEAAEGGETGTCYCSALFLRLGVCACVRV